MPASVNSARASVVRSPSTWRARAMVSSAITLAVPKFFSDERIINRIDALTQLFDSTPGAEVLGEFFGERGKTRNIGEQGRAVNRIWQLLTAQ